MHAGFVESFFLIFAGAAVLAAAALYTRQPLLVAYIALGGIAGPNGLGWVNDASMVRRSPRSGSSSCCSSLASTCSRPNCATWSAPTVVTAARQLADLLRGIGRRHARVRLLVDRRHGGRHRVHVLEHHRRLEALADHGPAPSPHRRNRRQPVADPGPHRDSRVDHSVRTRHVGDRCGRQRHRGVRRAAVAR